ncbi:MAG: family 43 glycosylhydrolase [Bacteroidia bacterium]|nr:family 43 glycosylhydrolase [Bacteroidia bacterium]
MLKKTLSTITLALFALCAYAQNPYLPLWEFIPDGEPYVFEDPDRPGEYRVYIYGSHDSLIKYYCGLEQVVWSAPVDNLGDWRYDGVIFKSIYGADGEFLNPEGKGDVLYAPDVTMKIGKDGKKEYYLFPNNQAGGRRSMIAKSDRPDGPFTVCNWDPQNPKRTAGVLAFDPAVFVDDDGRVYGYWGNLASHMAELDPETMATVKPGCEPLHNVISGSSQEGIFHFYEASSMRKIKDKYILIYSRMSPAGEYGLPESNYNLAYAYSDNPLGPFTYGGLIIDGRARDLDDNGNIICTANPFGNTHGSIQEINGQWWVFYHRQTGTDQYSRQAMVAPVTVSVEEGKGGKVTISEGEYNSEGFCTEGLNPLNKSAAGWACYLTNPKGITEKFPNFFFTGSYIKPIRLDPESYAGPFNLKQPFCPVVNNTSGSVVGYKYFNFDHTAGMKAIDFVAHIKPEGIDGNVTILVGGPKPSRGGRVIGELKVSGGAAQELQEVRCPVDALSGIKGKQSLFFVFNSATEDASICELYDFKFEERKK